MAIRDKGETAVAEFNAIAATEGIDAANAYATGKGLTPADDELATALDITAAAAYESASPFERSRISAARPGLHQHTRPTVQRELQAVAGRALAGTPANAAPAPVTAAEAFEKARTATQPSPETVAWRSADAELRAHQGSEEQR